MLGSSVRASAPTLLCGPARRGVDRLRDGTFTALGGISVCGTAVPICTGAVPRKRK
jgi:hypothetical protein